MRLVLLGLILVGALFLVFRMMSRKGAGGEGSRDTSTEIETTVAGVLEHCQNFVRNMHVETSFLVVLCKPANKEDAAAFAQISIEDGVFGVDHVFTSEANRESADKFTALAEKSGLTVAHREGNGVEYLRVVPADPPAFLDRVLREVLGLSDAAAVTVFWSWPESG